MLLLPSSTEGMCALLIAPAMEPSLATVKYTIPEVFFFKKGEKDLLFGIQITSWTTCGAAARLTVSSVVVIPVIIQSHDALLLLDEVVIGLGLQVEPTYADVLW